MDEKHFLIVYDIRDTKRLRRVSKIAESFGVRVQKSVFETSASPKTMDLFKHLLEKEINAEEDFVLFFEICGRDWQKRESYGKFTDEFSNDKFAIL